MRRVVLSRQAGEQRCVPAAGGVSTHSLGFLLHQEVPEVPLFLGCLWVLVFRVFPDDLADLVNPGIGTRQMFRCLIQSCLMTNTDLQVGPGFL